MREKDFQIKFNHWLKNVYKQTGAFELKITKTDSLPFSAVKQHQLDALLNAKKGVFVFKIPDCGYQNPFDTFCLTGVPAFIVIKYPDFFCLIDIDAFITEKNISTRKSLMAERAKELSTIII